MVVIPKNAYETLYDVIYDILSPEIKDPKLLDDLTDKYAYSIEQAGLFYLAQKYCLRNPDDVLSCPAAFSEYMTCFENACYALMQTGILREIRTKKRDPSILFNMTLDEMKPEVNREIHEDIRARQEVKLVVKSSKMYVCRCGHNETLVESKQIARADEPPTVTVLCLRCNSKWRSHI